MSFKPTAETLAKTLRSDGPPEPPTAVFEGAPFVFENGSYYCRVPGCSKRLRPFVAKHAIGVHMARRHGLNLEGNPSRSVLKGVSPTPPPPPKPPVSVRGIVVGTEGSLVTQAIRIVETAKANLGGKLVDMPLIAEKARRLEEILTYMRELV